MKPRIFFLTGALVITIYATPAQGQPVPWQNRSKPSGFSQGTWPSDNKTQRGLTARDALRLLKRFDRPLPANQVLDKSRRSGTEIRAGNGGRGLPSQPTKNVDPYAKFRLPREVVEPLRHQPPLPPPNVEFSLPSWEFKNTSEPVKIPAPKPFWQVRNAEWWEILLGIFVGVLFGCFWCVLRGHYSDRNTYTVPFS